MEQKRSRTKSIVLMLAALIRWRLLSRYKTESIKIFKSFKSGMFMLDNFDLLVNSNMIFRMKTMN